jgi:hypothetical protein
MARVPRVEDQARRPVAGLAPRRDSSFIAQNWGGKPLVSHRASSVSDEELAPVNLDEPSVPAARPDPSVDHRRALEDLPSAVGRPDRAAGFTLT